MKSSFTHNASFPLVFRAITDHSFAEGPFLPHAQVVTALLEDPLAAPLITSAGTVNGKGAEWTASNMVAWFSARFEKAGYSDFVERRTARQVYSYRSRHPLPTSPIPVDDDANTVLEGGTRLAQHLVRERNPKLAALKKQQVLADAGRLVCECCGFDAKLHFSSLDSPLVEVHHRVPLSALDKPSLTALDDLALLCPTCHRAIHRTNLSVEEFTARFFGRASPERIGSDSPAVLIRGSE